MTRHLIRHPIRDASGHLIAVHCRHDGPDGKRFWWEQPDGSSGLRGLSIADLPLYGIDRLTSTPSVVLVEGEKAASALLAIEVPAVGTVTGASSTPGADPLAELTGRSVHLWPDNDDVGREHMLRVAAGLVGVAADVSIIDWTDAPAHGDAADFLAAGGTRVSVEVLIGEARSFAANPSSPASATPGNAGATVQPLQPRPAARRRA